jgi:hypothetical protein
VALGHSQTSILDAAIFENQILKLSEIMIPPLMSSTMNGEAILGKRDNKVEEKQTGRPQKEDNEKSDKTILNQESMS